MSTSAASSLGNEPWVFTRLRNSSGFEPAGTQAATASFKADHKRIVTVTETFNDRYWSASREPQRSMTSRGYDPRQSPGYKRVVSCKDSSHGTDVLAVSEHGAPGRRPNTSTRTSSELQQELPEMPEMGLTVGHALETALETGVKTQAREPVGGFYNFERPHHGYRVRGRTPATIIHGAIAAAR